MNAGSIELTQEGRPATAAHAHHGGRGKLRFVGHFLEMQVAMMVGMGVGGPLGIPHVANVELRAALWMIAMIVPMVAWMRFRGMGWRPSAEMSAAMLVPTVAALPLLWIGLIPGAALIGIEHMSMAPAMLAFMIYRRSDYGW